jgi:nitrate reductase delta subunit
MTNEKATLWKLLSLGLSYPDPAFFEVLPGMAAAAAGLSDIRAREGLCAFTAMLKSQPLLKLQEHYTAVFELNPAASLNLTYHFLGDREDRGRALAELLDLYRRAGFEPAVSELPDYLPLVLEFLAVSPEAETHGLVRRCLSAVPAITGRLREAGSLYAAPLEILGGAVREPADGHPSPAGASGA